MGFNWTPDALRAARRLYLELGLSASESARRIGVTRSALIAKAHRMGWAEERHPALAAANSLWANRWSAPARPRLEARGDREPPALAPARGELPPGARPRPWMERRAGECAFPVAGESEAVMSCCAPSRGGTYCPAHRAALYRTQGTAQSRARTLERVAQWVDRMEQPAPRGGASEAWR